MEWHDWGYWLSLRPPGPQELRVVEVEVPAGSEGEGRTMPARIAALVAPVPGAGDSRVLVTAHRVPGFQLVLRAEHVDTMGPAALRDHGRLWT